MLRGDLLRRDPWNNYAAQMGVFAIAITAAILLLAHSTVVQAVVGALMFTIAVAPVVWIKGWKTQNARALLPNRFDLLEWVLVLGWILFSLVLLAGVERALGSI